MNKLKTLLASMVILALVCGVANSDIIGDDVSASTTLVVWGNKFISFGRLTLAAGYYPAGGAEISASDLNLPDIDKLFLMPTTSANTESYVYYWDYGNDKIKFMLPDTTGGGQLSEVSDSTVIATSTYFDFLAIGK